jgi:hypothetical protein
MKQSVKRRKLLDHSVKTFNKLSCVLRELIDEDCLSFAINVKYGVAVIEVVNCVNTKTGKVEHAIQSLIDRAGTYTEYVPRTAGIRIIGMADGQPIDLDCGLERSDSSSSTISIRRNCDRWVEVSGIPIVDDVFSEIDELIEQLVASIGKRIYLK